MGDLGLQETVASVTGAPSGIGEATALALARRGASVALVARRSDRLEVVASRIRNDGGTALVITADVTDQAQAEAAVSRAAEQTGPIGHCHQQCRDDAARPGRGAPIDERQRMVEVNVLGLLYCSHAALPYLLRAAEDAPRGVADLVSISSVAGRETRSGSGVYNATKHAVGAFSDALRKEVTKRHGRVSLVEPGAVPSWPAITGRRYSRV